MGITDGNTTYEDWRDHPTVDADAVNDERAMQKRMERHRKIGAALYIEPAD